VYFEIQCLFKIIAMKGRQKSKWIFWFVLLALFFLYNYPSILFFRPSSIHQWGQCDRASIALNYYKENGTFLNPAVNNLRGDYTGKGVSEMPLLQYLVAQCWKVIGFHEWLYRLVEVIILCCGLYCLFLLFQMLLKNLFLSLAGTILIFTSPILVFYGNNFLTDAPAFSFLLIGWYFFFRFRDNPKKKFLILFILAFTTSALLKVSSLINLAAIAGIYFFELIPSVKFGEGKKIFPFKILPLTGFLFAACVNLAWYRFAIDYNYLHDSAVFLTGTRPFWNCSNKLFVWQGFYKDMLPAFFHYYFIFVLILLFSFLFIFMRKNLLLLNYLVGSLFVGVLFTFLLFYESYRLHDYYLVTLLVLPAFLLISFFALLKKNYPEVIHSKIFIGIISFIIIFNVSYASLKTSIRYFSPKENKIYELLVSKDELALWRWYHADYSNSLKAFETIEPYNRLLGIKREDCVISLFDPSFNISLYMMDQKGFTIAGFGASRNALSKMIKSGGAKYLFVDTNKINDNQEIKYFLRHKIGNFRNIDIYKVDESLCDK
jgi:hypothetical protein